MDNQNLQGPIGVGLRPTHYPYLERRPSTRIRWFEAISENYMDSEGRPLDMLELIRRDYPVALHGVSLSIASAEGIRPQYLTRLKALKERIDPFIVSDHLCWTGTHASNLHDLLPFPFTQEALQVILDNVDHVQTTLGSSILLENVSTYLQLDEPDFTEWEFLALVAQRSGCRILLDVNNLYVNARNLRFDPMVYVNSLRLDLIGQIHLAGFTDLGTHLFDTHSRPVYPEVWELFTHIIARLADVPVLIEWDADIPEFPILEQEADKADRIWVQCHGRHFSEPVSSALS